MSETILYIDDAPELPDGAQEELGRIGYRLVQTSDPDEGLRLAREMDPALVLLEVLLPGRDGLTLVEEVRSWSGPVGEVPIAIITRGERSPQLYGRALELGANDFLCKPVLRAELLAAVLECIEGEAKRRARAGAGAKDLSGDLADCPLPDLLLRLHRSGLSGVLHIQNETEDRAIQLRNGSPIAVGSERGIESLEDFLVRTKRISGDEHEAAIDRVTVGMGNVREVLVGMGALSESELEDAIGARAAEPMLEAFGWASGGYRFETGEQLDSSQSLDLEQHPVRLLFEGVIQWTPDAVVRKLIRRRGPLYVSKAEPLPCRCRDLGPSACSPGALDRLLGDRTVGEVLDAREFDERALYGLLVAGMVEVHPEPVLMLMEAMTPEPADEDLVEEELPVGPPRPAAPPPASTRAPRTAEPLDLEQLDAELTSMARRILSADDFGVLELAEDANDEQVRAAYERVRDAIPLTSIPTQATSLLKLARKLRDRIERAYEHLRDADSRRAFAALRRESREANAEQEGAARSLEAEKWFRKGEGLLRVKDFEKAVEAFGMAAHLDPKEGEYLAHLGYALHLSNPLNELVRREALEHIAKGIKLSPKREKSLVYLGRVFKAAGDQQNARKMFRRALKIRPDCHEALQEMRLLQMRQSKARGLLHRILKR